MNFIWGIIGIVILIGLAVALSANRKAINIRTVLWALVIQLIFAFIVLKWEAGKRVLEALTSGVQRVIDSANAGIEFLFGGLFEGEGIGFIFAFQVFPIIIFFASLISVLYYLGIMQWVIKLIGGGLAKLLKTSKAESMSAAANIFVGHTEAPLVVKPYIKKMTGSELFVVMVGGLATVSGAQLAGYAAFGVPLEYLLAACFMAAPSALLMAKIMMPETELAETSDTISFDQNTEAKNVLDAAAYGASDGLKLALNIGAMLIAFISLIALINMILGSVGGLFGFDSLSLEFILGTVFAPVAFAIGVPWEEALQAGSFLGQKLVVNEFVAYSSFGPFIPDLSAKTVAIISFALCGFANFGSIAILLGALGSLAPNRRHDVARLGVRAVIAATLANLLNGTVAGMFIF